VKEMTILSGGQSVIPQSEKAVPTESENDAKNFFRHLMEKLENRLALDNQRMEEIFRGDHEYRRREDLASGMARLARVPSRPG